MPFGGQQGSLVVSTSTSLSDISTAIDVTTVASYRRLSISLLASSRMARTVLPMLPERERGTCTPIDARLRPERAESLSELLKVLADPTRLQIVVSLRDAGDAVCVCDCTAAFGLSQPTMSHHLARLRDAGVLDVARKGGWGYYSLKRDLPAATRRVIEAL